METFKYHEIPHNICFTFKDAVKVYYKDSEVGEHPHFHSYKDGYLFETSTKIHSKNMYFYACDIKGRYIPISLVLENRNLKKENIKLRSKLESSNLINSLPTLYVSEENR